MKGTQLGEFEELVLLVVGVLGLNIREEILTKPSEKWRLAQCILPLAGSMKKAF